MAKHSPLITSFNGGELSEFLAGRPDVAKYANGCRTMENFIPMVEGPAFTRPGVRHVTEVKDSGDRTWLVRFEFSVADSYIMEFGDGYIRFYTDHGQVQVSGVTAYNGGTAYTPGDLASSGGVNYYCKVASTGNAPPNTTYWHALTGAIYEIPSPYTAALLTNDDGTLALRYAQTGDVVYITCPSRRPRKLSRFGATDWVLSEIEFSPPPFQPLNATATTMYASAATGSVTLTASAAAFSATNVGDVVYLGEKNVRDNALWQTAVAVTAGDERRSDGKNYVALTSGTTGNVKPTHSSGAEFDGDPGVQWEYADAGYGYAKITAYTDTTHVTATVVSPIPTGAIGSGNASTRWALDAWTLDDGLPTSVTFFRERLVFARDSTLWFSVTADFENFAYDISGQVTADAGFDRTISSDRVNTIRWLSPDDILLVGTMGDEWACNKATTSDPFGPNNCEIKRQSTYGSSQVMPQRVGNVTLFVQRAGRKVRAMEFRFERDGFQSDNICAFHRSVTTTGIVDMAYQQEPHSIVWACRTDGELVACTFDREQDVVAWHRHPITDAIVECVECIPSPNGGRDDLWVIARFTIDGETKRYVGYLTEEADAETAQEDWFYVDFGATYDGAAATTISGLGHLEGKEVWVLVDGARHPNRTVTSGAITLQLAGSVVQVGLPSPGTLETMDIEAGSASGTSQGKIKRAPVVTVRVLNSLGGTAGPDADHLEEIRYRYPSMAMGSAPPPFTGDLEVEWPADYDLHNRIMVVKDRPMPLTVIALMPQVVGSEGR
jgi:hypothetical protein